MNDRVLDGKENGVGGWLRQLDGLLRGDATRLQVLRRGAIEISPDGLCVIIIALGLIYGLCMGCYAIFQTGGASWPQMLSTMGKVPLLFILTLIVTFPSLYVFNALVGSRLTLASVLRLIIAALAVMLAILASFGPIVAFFSASTTSYQFMLLLNVAVFAVSGFLGLKFLLLTLHRLSLIANEPTQPAASAPQAAPQAASQAVRPNAVGTNAGEPNGGANVPRYAQVHAQTHPAMPTPGALERTDDRVLGRDVKAVFRIWIVVFGLVGAQMSWVLRPFLGHPGRDFILFAQRESNFFEAVWKAAWGL